MSKWMLRAILTSLAIALWCVVGQCMVLTSHGGKWPKDWPAELEPLRAEATTIDVATGTQEHIYEISFADAAAFQKAWPALLKVRTPGSPLRLQRIRSAKPGSWESIASNATPKVRIYAPVRNSGGGKVANILPGETTPRKGAELLPYRLGPPWPAELVGSQGELPEYVTARPQDGKAELVEVKAGGDRPLGFHHRARTDLELVVDGKVIDLNQIELPKDALIVDRRFEPTDPKIASGQ